MKNRILGLLLVLVFAMGVLSGCQSKDSTDKKTDTDKDKNTVTAEAKEDNAKETNDSTLNQAKVIHAGYQGSQADAWLEKSLHYYEEEFAKDGITFVYDQFLSGPPMIESMTAGELDFGGIGDMPPINARGQGIDVKVISKMINTPFSNSLAVGIGSDIKEIADLKGKKIATQIGSSGHHFVSLVLEQAGLSLDDVELLNLSAPDGINALASGEIDALSTWEPYGSQLVNRKAGTILLDSTGIKQNTSTFIVRNDFAKENPELTARFIKVWLKYRDFIESNREKALEIIVEQSGFSREDIQRTFLEGDLNPEFTDYDYDQESKTKNFLIETGTLENDFDINDLYDFSYLKRAKELYESEKGGK